DRFDFLLPLFTVIAADGNQKSPDGGPGSLSAAARLRRSVGDTRERRATGTEGTTLLALLHGLERLERLEDAACRLERRVEVADVVQLVAEIVALRENAAEVIGRLRTSQVVQLADDVSDLIAIRVDRVAVDRAEERDAIGVNVALTLIGQELEALITDRQHERLTTH